ncbi:MAG: right-handed parallel beta-helix repeat-containing protein [Acidobacteria bacterium]|nr:right-handed parallel beta-helix repeat-containing protein [Acidobacteriota bacterium]
MRALRIAFLTTLTLTLTTSAFAGTWYVAPPASGGSDSNPGTLASPFATITKGVSMLSAAGDVLNVRGGTYNESVTVWHKYGSSSDPIRIQNYTNEHPVIDGTGTTTNDVVVIDECSYVRFDGFEVKNGPKGGIGVWDADNVKVRWNDVHDCQNIGIGAGCTTVGTTHDITFDGNDVKRCVLSNSARTATSGWQQAMSSFKCDHVTFVNNYVHESYGEGIDFIVGDYATIANNTLYDNYSTNVYIDNGRHVTVDSNFIITGWGTNPSQYYRDGHPAGGISVANEYYEVQKPSTDLLITNNITAWTNTGFGYGDWDYGGGLHYTTIANNTFYHANTDTILINDDGTNETDTTVIENNIIDAYSDHYSAEAPSAGITWRTNDWYGGLSGHTFPGTGDITSDPQLVNPSNGGGPTDYKLQSTSPCRNIGTTESLVTHDYWGTARSSGSYDIGAHEY